MIRLIHARSGGDMWVHESRLDEYLAAGHKLAASPSAAKPEAKKKPTKKKEG